MSPILTALAVGGLGWLLWLLTHNFLTRSLLEKIPGPKSASWIQGRSVIYHFSCPSLITLKLHP